MSLEKRVAEPEQGLEGGTDCKKLKYEGESAVVHARNLPVDCTEDELNTLGQSFGKIVNILILKGKSQAFIELDSPAAASQLLSFYSQSPPHIRRKLLRAASAACCT
jgi:polypyrimidine tract-binding protein 3